MKFTDKFLEKGFIGGLALGLVYFGIEIKNNPWMLIAFIIEIILTPLKIVLLPLLLIKPIRDFVMECGYDAIETIDSEIED